MLRTKPEAPTNRFDVLVSNGYGYEYETTICAKSVRDARAIWARRGDWKSEKFKVRHASPSFEGASS